MSTNAAASSSTSDEVMQPVEHDGTEDNRFDLVDGKKRKRVSKPGTSSKASSKKSKENGQRPAAERDDRKPEEVRASIKAGPSFAERLAFFKEHAPKAHAVTYRELEPQADDTETAAARAAAAAENMTDEEKAEAKAKAQEHLERNVMMPKIRDVLIRRECDTCYASVVDCCCGPIVLKRNMIEAKLTPAARDVWMKWSSVFDAYCPQIEVDNGDLLERGLQPKDAEAVTAPQVRAPCLTSVRAYDPNKFKCPWGADGCKGTGHQIQLLSQLHDIELKKNGGDTCAADRVIVKLVVDMCDTDGVKAYEALRRRVGACVCCNNGECKVRAGIWMEQAKIDFINREEQQGANEINHNPRYQSDQHFKNDLSLAHRLFLDPNYPEFVEHQARRMVADTAQFSYFVEMREREAIGTTMAFIEACEAFGVPWDHVTKQEFLDRAKMVPRNHILLTVADHVVSRDQFFGVAGKRDWEAYRDALVGKIMFPEPNTGICLMLRIKNWEANGKPVLDGKLVDRIDSKHPAIALFGTAAEFHHKIEEVMRAAQTTPYLLEYTASEASLNEGTKTASYRQSFRAIQKATGKQSALQLSLFARFMKDHGSSVAHMTKPSMIHLNGSAKVYGFAPACADVFYNCNVTTLERVQMYARAYGLGSDYKKGRLQVGTTAPFRLGAEVELKDFCTKLVPSLMLQACVDRSNSSGHRVLPSQLVDLDPDAVRLPEPGTTSFARASKAGASSSGASSSSTPPAPTAYNGKEPEPLGKEHRNAMLFVGMTPVRGDISAMGCSTPPIGPDRVQLVNLTPLNEGSMDGVFPKMHASQETAREHVYQQYVILTKEEKVLDPSLTSFEEYCTLDVENMLMRKSIGRERAKKQWHEWLKTQKTFPLLMKVTIDKCIALLTPELTAAMEVDDLGTVSADRIEIESRKIIKQLEKRAEDTAEVAEKATEKVAAGACTAEASAKVAAFARGAEAAAAEADARWQLVKDGLKGCLWSEWTVSMTEDPGDTAKGPIKVKADYDAYLRRCKAEADRAVVKWDKWIVKHPPNAAPTHFGYWCSLRDRNPDEEWPEMPQLRLKYAVKMMLHHESRLLALRDGVAGDKRGSLAEALHKERMSALRRLKPKSTQEQKDAKLDEEREESDLFSVRFSKFQELSKHLDRVLKPRYARWMYDRANLDTDPEKEQIMKIDDAFERSLDLRFEGGSAHELERQRLAMTKDAFKVDDRALAKAELEIVRQDQTRKLNEAEVYRHERPEAADLERAAARVAATENDDDEKGDKGVDPLIGDRVEDMELSNLTNARMQARKATEVVTKTEEISKDKLEFPVDGDYAWRTPEQLQARYVNPRLQGLDWIDENGRDKGAMKRKR